jgi:hypothetical protein
LIDISLSSLTSFIFKQLKIMENNYDSDQDTEGIESDNESLELVLTVEKVFSHGMKL